MSDLSNAQHFSAIREALAPYESIWNHEVLYLNWNLSPTYPAEWIDSLLSLSDEEAFLLDTGRHIPSLHPDILELLEGFKGLTRLPRASADEVEFDKKSFVFIKEKKVHEILQILPLMRELKKARGDFKLIDIGGGVGHLARALAFEAGINVTTIDASEQFQTQGKTRLSRLRAPTGAGSINYFQAYIEKGDENSELNHLFGSHQFSLGLHTCGNLALSHIEKYIAANQQGMLNFGCCYNKLDPLADVHLSKLARENPLPFNIYALSLATRGYAKLTQKDYLLKKRVKLFRYGLHFLLESEFGLQTPFPVGECNTRIYWGDFHTYAIEKLQEHGFRNHLSSGSIDSFLERREIRDQIDKMIACDLIRWQFGRPIEYYLLLDRALKLEESGRSASLKEFFDETISPRNIGLISLS